MLRARLLTALVGIPLMLTAIFAPGGGLFAFALSLLAAIGMLEYQRAYAQADWFPKPCPNPLLLIGGAGLPFLLWMFPELNLVLFLLPALALAMLYELGVAWRTGRQAAAPNIGYGIFGMLYIGWLFSFGTLLRNDSAPILLWGQQVERGTLWTLWLFAMLWSGDSAAYFVGKAIGKHRIARTISPTKTIEGFVANLAFCALIGWQGGIWLGLSSGWAIAAGVGVGILGQLGDLFESALKRSVGVKDFGGVLPGHGGVLDRFDSFLFSAPWLWWVVQAAG
ncbi:MAG: phosphatidate cytidylyltransferase [Fimbriimonadales bacterium]|nr:phosphatidate cytidylyltransferase [Fimbriimonadales bacterium]